MLGVTDIIEQLRDVLTVRKLATETRLDEATHAKIIETTDRYLEALLPK